MFDVSPGVLCRTTPTSVYLSAPVPVGDEVPTVVGLGRGTVGVVLAAVTAVRPVMGGLLVNTDTVLADVLGGAHVAVLSVDPSAASVDVTPGNTTPVTCGLHDGVAYCLYRAGSGPTVFTARAADGAVVGRAAP